MTAWQPVYARTLSDLNDVGKGVVVLVAAFYCCTISAPALHGQTFTKITSEPISNDTGRSTAAAWGDYDNDGDQDLVIVHHAGQANSLYRNNGDGSFTRILSAGRIVQDTQNSSSACWGDYDNDGDLDLFVTNLSGSDFLYRNNGNSTFSSALRFISASDDRECAWGDYDNDGFIDLFLAIRFGRNNALYHNNRDGTFGQITTGPIVSGGKDSYSGVWGDYDGDGDLDLFVANGGNNDLYRNEGDGTFSEIDSGPVVNDGVESSGASWADFDNDGDLDLFVSNASFNTGPSDTPPGLANALYTNNGDGTFRQVLSGSIVEDVGNSQAGNWADYDNDGDLDLLVTNEFYENNALYQNEGDGTFAKVVTGPVVSDDGFSRGSAWADYDNDGDLDLVVANQFGPDFLYANGGNSNHWVNLLLVGTISNRSAIGARVKLKATISGETVWQMQDVSSKSARGSQNSLNAEFGLGDAAVVEEIRIEWPSGIVQVLRDVAADQFLTITEAEDTTPPEITIRSAPIVLWPPNHQYQRFSVFDLVTAVADDHDGNISIDEVRIASATSDEPERSKGSGNTLDDVAIAAECSTVDLRAERQGTGNGRVYTIHLEASDQSGNVGTASFQVHVPHSRGNRSKVVDSGAAYTVASDCGGSESTSHRLAAGGQSGAYQVAETPNSYSLDQNYPNPFNPSTSVRFSLPEAVHVSLVIYDLTGRVMDRLVDGALQAGEHDVRYDATHMPSGVYLYRLATPNQVLSRTMHLVK